MQSRMRTDWAKLSLAGCPSLPRAARSKVGMLAAPAAGGKTNTRAIFVGGATVRV